MTNEQRKVIWEKVKANEQQSFWAKLNDLIIDKKMKPSEVYNKALIDRQTFGKFKSSSYHPSKRFTFALAAALKLSVEETSDLISRVGQAFNPADKFDLIVEECFNRGIYDIDEINYILYENHYELLGGIK